MNRDGLIKCLLVIGTVIVSVLASNQGYRKGLREGYVKGVQDVEASYKLNEMPEPPPATNQASLEREYMEKFSLERAREAYKQGILDLAMFEVLRKDKGDDSNLLMMYWQKQIQGTNFEAGAWVGYASKLLKEEEERIRKEAATNPAWWRNYRD